MKKKYIAVAPGNAATGGVELLHQLVDSINKFSDNQAFICHYPFGKRFELSKQYEKYNCPIETKDEVSFTNGVKRIRGTAK